MGQSISKNLVPRLNSALKSYEKAVAQDALDDVARRRSQAARTDGYTDPTATISGFGRDKGPSLRKDVEQEAFLKKSQGAAAPQEMPEDLIKFLNDVGPLEKSVDKAMTSPKVFDSLTKEEDGRKQREAKSKRTRRTMPLAEVLADGLDANAAAAEGARAMGVQRTTNFSTAELSEDDAELKLTDGEMVDLLRKYGATDGTSASASSGGNKISGCDAAANAEAYVQQHFPPDRPGMTDDRRASHVSLLSNAFAYTGMPILMKDVDSDFVGTWQGRVADLERMKLRVVTEAEATFVFEDDDAVKTDGGIQGKVIVDETATGMALSALQQSQENGTEEEEENVSESRKGRIGSSGPSSASFLERELRLRKKDGVGRQASR